jgi:DNA-binding PadR family transcriptional regulator
MRLEQSGSISSEWGTSDNNRRARFYSITRQGRKQLALEAEGWQQMSAFITRMETHLLLASGSIPRTPIRRSARLS